MVKEYEITTPFKDKFVVCKNEYFYIKDVFAVNCWGVILEAYDLTGEVFGINEKACKILN